MAKTTIARPQILRNDSIAPGVTIELVELTPQLAKDFLARRPKRQRNVSAKQVQKYMRDLMKKNWPFIGGVIGFNVHGDMVDGQHRCEAVIAAGARDPGVAIPAIVVRGLDLDAIVVMDTGRGRSFRDMLVMEDIVNVDTVSATTKKIWYWEHGNYADAGVPRQFHAPFLHVTGSNSELWDTYKRLETEIQDAAHHGNSLAGVFRTAMPNSIWAFTWMLYHRLDVDAAENWFHELRKGPAQVGPEYPIAALRAKLTKRRTAADAKIPAWVWLHYSNYCWSAYINGGTVGGLKRPPVPKHNFVAMPVDPNADERPEGWQPLPLAGDFYLDEQPQRDPADVAEEEE